MTNLRLTYDQATAQGHTLLTKDLARALLARSGRRLERAEVEEAYRLGELTKFQDGVAAPDTLAKEARVAAWFANRGTASATLTWLPAVAPSGCNSAQGGAWGQIRGANTALVTGLPGAGKTWLVARVVEVAVQAGKQVLCATPTGKAASVLSLKLDRFPVSTLHKLLGVVPGQLVNPNPVHADLLVIDEFSMVDVALLDCLLQAVGPRTAVLFSGDPNQLPPVGLGYPAKDLVDWYSEHEQPGVILVHLDRVERQAAGSDILELATALHRSQLLPLGTRNITVRRVPTEEIEPTAVGYCLGSELAELHQLTDPYRQVLVLTPVKAAKFEASTSRINQAVSHARFPERDLARSKFARGDRLIFTVNNYTHGFVNGEMGTLVDYQSAARHARIDNDGGYRYELDSYSLGQYAEWGYALTVHKAQGSEAEVVVLLLHPEAGFMYSLNLLYTAVTRAKRHLLLVGDLSVLKKALFRREVRSTALPTFLSDAELRTRWAKWSLYVDLSHYAEGYAP